MVWNGSRIDNFSPTRGLRKGDPRSHLFVMCMEKISFYIQKLVDDGIWNPINVSRGGPSIPRLFVDGIRLFCKSNDSHIRLIRDTLEVFCEESTLKVNIFKS